MADGKFITTMQYGRNGVYVFDCRYCGKHHERPVGKSVNPKHPPAYCDIKCFKLANPMNQAGVNQRPEVVEKRRIGMKRWFVAKMAPVLADVDRGMSVADAAIKYNRNPEGLKHSIKKARVYIEEAKSGS